MQVLSGVSQAGSGNFFNWRNEALRDGVGPVNLAAYDNSDFDRGASPFVEALWWVARSLFFAGWFPLPSALRCAVLRMFGARIGSHVVIRSRVNVTFPWRLEIGNHVWIGEEVLLLSLAPLKIGNHVCLSQRAFLCTGSHDIRSEAFSLVTRPIVIEDHCWIAAGAFVGPGVTVGRHSVCAAGSITLRDVPPESIASGNPSQARFRDTNQPGGR